MRIIATALIECSSHNSREAVDSWFKTELSGVASRRSVVARLTGPAGGRNEPRCEADVWHPFGYRPDDSIRRVLFAEAIQRANAEDESFAATDQFLSSGACSCGRAGDSLPDLPVVCGARGAWIRIRVAGANRCSAGRRFDSDIRPGWKNATG